MVTATVNPAVAEALRLISLSHAPGVHWLLGDDLCDCLFQRIGEWSNPYLGRTQRVRLCCIWAELYKQYPEFVQEVPYYDPNRHKYVVEPAEWNDPVMDMPVYLWHRQLAIQQNKTVAQIKEEYADRDYERPKRNPNAVQDEPTEDEVRWATEQRLKAAGWLLSYERLEDEQFGKARERAL